MNKDRVFSKAYDLGLKRPVNWSARVADIIRDGHRVDDLAKQQPDYPAELDIIAGRNYLDVWRKGYARGFDAASDQDELLPLLEFRVAPEDKRYYLIPKSIGNPMFPRRLRWKVRAIWFTQSYEEVISGPAGLEREYDFLVPVRKEGWKRSGSSTWIVVQPLQAKGAA